jgi:hypothetical protein
MLRIIHRIKAWIRKGRSEKKLAKSGYHSWYHYKHNRDEDVYMYANYVHDFYKGYPYVHVIKDYNHYAFKLICDEGPCGSIFGYDEMTFWCEEKIRWNYRRDIHRVIENASGLVEFNDIGGSDYIYFAFKNEKDFTHFLLRWS